MNGIRSQHARDQGALQMQRLWRGHFARNLSNLRKEEKREKEAASVILRFLRAASIAKRCEQARGYALLSHYARRIQKFMCTVLNMPCLSDDQRLVRLHGIVDLDNGQVRNAEAEKRDASRSDCSNNEAVQSGATCRRSAKFYTKTEGRNGVSVSFSVTQHYGEEKEAENSSSGRRLKHLSVVHWAADLSAIPDPARISRSVCVPSEDKYGKDLSRPEPHPPLSAARGSISKARARMRLLAALRSGRRDLLRDAIASCESIPDLQGELERAWTMLCRLSHDYLEGCKTEFPSDSIALQKLSPREIHRRSHVLGPANCYRSSLDRPTSRTFLPMLARSDCEPSATNSLRPLSPRSPKSSAAPPSPLSPRVLQHMARRYVLIDHLDMSAQVARVQERIARANTATGKLPTIHPGSPRTVSIT